MHVSAALEHDTHAGVLIVALKVIAEMGVEGTTYLEAVLANLHHERWNVQLNVVYALAKLVLTTQDFGRARWVRMLSFKAAW